ncbi:serine protease [Mastigocladus laminosus UU774]|nr:serine protease [Mastigocladus laminosus UU774]
MPGIDPKTYSQLCEALLDCEQFDEAQRLRNFFKANAALRPWRHRWKNSSPRELVEDAIGLLNDKHTSDTNENALIVLIRLLANIPENNHQILIKLAEKLEITFSGNSLNQDVKQEANPTGEQMIYIATDEKLFTCASAVARVSVPKIVNGIIKKIPTGTGWLVTPELAFTCWHVIEARGSRDSSIRSSDLQQQVTNSVLTFDYNQPSQGIEYGVMQLEYKNIDLDYSLLRLRDRPDYPLHNRGFLKLDANAPLTIQSQLYVIQHPKGQQKQRSAGRFIRFASNPNQILHSAPTEEGTSGAAVLNVTNWQVVALHNGENDVANLRQATLIDAILVDLQQNSLKLYEEIMTVQTTY